MSNDIFEGINRTEVKKEVTPQGPPWSVVARFESFEPADERRKSELASGKQAKVARTASGFSVKVREANVRNEDPPTEKRKTEIEEKKSYQKPKRS